MDLMVLDETFNRIQLVDTFESLLWTERYAECGDFEIYTPINANLLELSRIILDKKRVGLDCYLTSREAEHNMIIETIEITTDSDLGPRLIMSGRSLESILDRRIVYPTLILDSKVQTAVKRLLTKNVIEPDDQNRVMPNIVFEETDDPEIDKITIKAQFTGDNLYEVLCNICEETGIGFMLTLKNKKMVFKLYKGLDRSQSQTKNPRVIFSPKFENIVDSNFKESAQEYRNVAIVAGEERETGRVTVEIGEFTGLKRKEIYVDARDLQSEDEEGEPIPEEEYLSDLKNRGQEKLLEYKYINTFEGQVEAVRQFIYGRDFFKGDVVQLMTEYGIGGKARIKEFIRSYDRTGYNVYPTFEMVE